MPSMKAQAITRNAQLGSERAESSQSANGNATAPIMNIRNTAGPSALSFAARARPHSGQ